MWKLGPNTVLENENKQGTQGQLLNQIFLNEIFLYNTVVSTNLAQLNDVSKNNTGMKFECVCRGMSAGASFNFLYLEKNTT